MLLGGFDLTFDGESIPVSVGAQRVLAFLALSDRPLGRMYVAGVLWSDTSDKRASGSLRQAVWDLRASGHDLVDTRSHNLRLAGDLHVDYRCALALAERILDMGSPAPEPVLERDLLRGDLLCDWYDDWVANERERFRQRRLHVLESLCERATRDRQFAHAVEAGLAAVQSEPLRESAQRILIRAYLAEGNRNEALRQYRAYEALLRDELGADPSEELQRLVGRPRQGDTERVSMQAASAHT